MSDEEGFRVSPQQAVAWTTSLEAPSRCQSIYSAELKGELDPARFRDAMAGLVSEWEILRTSLKIAPGAREPVQMIADGDDGSWWVSSDADATSLQLDGASSPSFRVQLSPLDGGGARVTLWASTALSDWCGLRNVTHACLQRVTGQAPEGSDEDPLQYADVAEWLHELRSGEDAADGIAYWKQQQLGAQPWPIIPQSMESDSPFEQSVVATALTPGACETLRSYCTEDRPIRAVLLANWQLLLSRLCGQDSFHLLVGCDGRGYEGLDTALGLFQSSCPLATSLDASSTFASASLTAARGLADLDEYQEAFSWEHIAGATELAAGGTGPTTIAMHVGFEHVDLAMEFAGGGLSSVAEPPSGCREPSLLRLLCATRVESGKLSVECRFQYDQHRIEAGQVEGIAAQFEALLDNALARPESSIAELDILPEAQRSALLEMGGRADPYEPLPAHHWFERLVDERPDATALVALGTAAGPKAARELAQPVTYRDLDLRANRIARRLIESGVKKGDLVVLCCPRSINMVAAILGVLKAGGAYVPMDPEYPRARSQFILEDTGAKVLLADPAVVHGLPDHTAQIVLLDEDLDGTADADDDARPDVAVSGEDLAYLIYTSGSTGKPKGVEILHRNLAHSTDARHRYYGPSEKRFMLLSSYAFDSSVAGIFGTLCQGATLVLPEEGVQRELSRIAEVIETQNVTDLLWLPSAYQRLLDEQGKRLGSLRRVIVAGEACLPDLIRQHRAALPDIELHNEYGPAEATVWTTVYNTAAYADGDVPIGTPVSRARLIVVSPGLRLLPLGVAGEICIAGDGVARGYHGRPELTQEKFVEVEGQRFYRSGDHGRLLPDGNLIFLGRRDAQVKVNGYRIELGEIETAFAAHPRVTEAIVEPRQRPGGEDLQLVAYLTIGSSSQASKGSNGRPAHGAPEPDVKLTELRGFLLERLPHYMLPTYIEILSKMPRLPNGKVDRSQLPAPGASAHKRAASGDDVLPRSPVEEVVMDIWSDVLGVSQPKRFDNFFDLGGQSLNGLQVVDLANKRGLSITPAHLFQYPVLADLAAAAETRQTLDSGDDDSSTLITLQPRGDKQPLFLVHSVAGDLLHYGQFVHHMGQDRPIYGFQALGLKNMEATHKNLPAMAKHYVDVMTRFQPEGPYHLAGLCFGGTVLIEMAHILRAQGRELGLLGLLEAEPWPPPTLASRYYEAKALVQKGPGAFTYIAKKVKYWLEGEVPGFGAEVFSLEYDQGPFKNREHVYKTNIAAQVGYVTRPLPEKVTLFKAEIRGEDRLMDGDYNWRLFASTVESHVVPGKRDGFLQGTNAEYLAGLMRSCLERA